MKATSGFLEIIFILVIMAASIPFLRILIYTMDQSEYEYLMDKTLNGNTSLEYIIEVDPETGNDVLVPNYTTTKKYQFQEIIVSLFTFDEYSPKSNKIRIAELENGVVRITKEIDLTDFLNYRDKEDLLDYWMKFDPKLEDYKTNADTGLPWDFYLLEYSSTHNCWIYTAQVEDVYGRYFYVG